MSTPAQPAMIGFGNMPATKKPVLSMQTANE